MNKKGFGLIGLLIVLGVVAVLGGGALYGYQGGFFGDGTASSTTTGPIDAANKAKELLEKKNEEDTAYGLEFSQYKNEEFGIKFTFPVSSMSVRTEKEIPGISIIPIDASPEGPFNLIFISPTCAPINESLKPRKVSLGGISMERYDIVPGSFIFHFPSPNSKSLVWNKTCNQITVSAVHQSSTRDLKVFEDILNSLKFE